MDSHIYEQLCIPEVNQIRDSSSASEASVEGPRMNPAEMVNMVSDILRRSLNTADSTETQEIQLKLITAAIITCGFVEQQLKEDLKKLKP